MSARPRRVIRLFVVVVGIACCVSVFAQVRSDTSATPGSDPTAPYTHDLINQPVTLDNIKSFQDAALLHLNAAIKSEGVQVAKGNSERCAVDTRAALSAIDTRAICTKSLASAELKPLSLAEAVALRQVLTEKVNALADARTANPSAKITIDQYGISGSLNTSSDIAATDANALAAATKEEAVKALKQERERIDQALKKVDKQ